MVRPVPVTMGSSRSRTVERATCRIVDAWFPPRAVLAPHSHERAIFAVIVQGAIESEIRTRRLECTSSTAWTEPIEERHANRVSQAGARVLVIQPDPKDEDGLAPFRKLLDGVAHGHHAGIAMDALRIMTEMDEPDDVSAFAIDGLVLTMLATGARVFGPRRFHAAPPPWILAAQELLHAHFREHLELAAVARTLGVHPANLSRTFRRHFHSSPGDYVRALRLHWAAERLAASEDSISRVAVRAGFSDQAHLTREFRRRMGVTPATWRTSHGGKRAVSPDSPPIPAA